jgi:hypothetical protein
MGDARRGDKSPFYKKYARIIKNGKHGVTQNYAIVKDSEKIKQSTSINKLLTWFEETYPDEEIMVVKSCLPKTNL